MQFLADRLNQFWWFICERQVIWHKRVVQKLPFPWTTHPVLQRERFTNVYRELDPGTQYVITNILEQPAPKADKIFNTMLYRLVGRAETHAALGFQYLDAFDPTTFTCTLKQLRDVDRTPPFTAAYMVSAYRQMGSHDKIENIARLFALLQRDFADLYTRIEACHSSAEVHAVLSSVYGFGNFLAYQVLVDLLYPLRIYDNAPLLPYSHNDWASAGPGAQRGITLLLQGPGQPQGIVPIGANLRPQGDRKGSPLQWLTNPLPARPPDHWRDGPLRSPCGSMKIDGALAVMRWLHAHQHDEFARLELDFPYLSNAQGRIPLSLANIQNCLCEFHKFVKISEGWGRGRRKFRTIS